MLYNNIYTIDNKLVTLSEYENFNLKKLKVLATQAFNKKALNKFTRKVYLQSDSDVKTLLLMYIQNLWNSIKRRPLNNTSF